MSKYPERLPQSEESASWNAGWSTSIPFLRRLQRLRSKLVAHRKGSDYKKVLDAESVDQDTVREVVLMLWNALRFLEDLARHAGIDLEGR